MTTPAELGLVTPDGQDWTRDGDNAISQNAQVLAMLYDELITKIGNPVRWRPNSLLPANVNDWIGINLVGIYALPTQGSVDAITNRPSGARRGYVQIMPLGSTHSEVRWIEAGVDAPQTYEMTVSSVVGETTFWRRIPRTKLTGLSLTLTGGVAPKVIPDGAQRHPVRHPFDVKRGRIHIRNYNLRDSVPYPGVVNIVGLSIGEAAQDANGELTGAWIDGTSRFLSGAAQTPGTPTASEWVSPLLDLGIQKGKTYLVSIGWTADASQNIVQAKGGAFILTGGSVNTHTVAPAGTWSSESSFEVWIEAEIDESVEVHALSADSLGVGTSSSKPVFDSWFAKWCYMMGYAPRFYAASGDTLANFGSTLPWKANQWNKMCRAAELHCALGSNDLFGAGRSFEEMKTLLNDHLAVMRQLVSNVVTLYSIWPRFDAASPAEAVRKQWNEYLETTLPGGALMYRDTAQAITNPDGSTINKKWTASPTDIHLSTPGYARVASSLLGGVRHDPQSTILKNIVSEWDGGAGGGRVELLRAGHTVQLSIYGNKAPATPSSTQYVLPVGFRPPSGMLFEDGIYGAGGSAQRIIINSNGSVNFFGLNPGDTYYTVLSWLTIEPMPTA